MYVLRPGTKQDSVRQWNLSDRAFFGYGELVRVEANMCEPADLARIGMQVRAPDKFLYNALPRARKYLTKYDRKHREHC